MPWAHEVASSSLASPNVDICRDGGIGRRGGLKIRCQQWRVGSTPSLGNLIWVDILQSFNLNVMCMGKEIKLHGQIDYIDCSKVLIDRARFAELCRVGCKNYAQKYCCPPHAPGFNEVAGNCQWLGVVFLSCDLGQITSKNQYHRIRVANVIMKSRLESFLRRIRSEYKLSVLGSGACRACKECGARKEIGCKKPLQKLMSLEATGVNCQQLVQDVFGVKMEWYSANHMCKFTSVVGGILVKERNYDWLSYLLPAQQDTVVRYEELQF
jgi:predicted metal-binding protein